MAGSAAAPAGREKPVDRAPWSVSRADVRLSAGLFVGALLLGLIALGVGEAGAADRPALAAIVLVVGIAAAVAPLHLALPIAVVLGGFGGYLTDFAGDRALYWNEAFAAVLVARSLVRRRPSQRELLVCGGIVLVLVGYLATGTSAKADFWGVKVLLTSVAIGWAVARLGVGRREWLSLYYGLAVLTVASVVLEVWQRAKGVEGLRGLGLVYGPRVREVTGGGHVRAFAGFTSAAPLSYALAITLCVWFALVLGGERERRVAIATAWVPPVAVAGIYLTVDRTALVGLLLAIGIVAAIAQRSLIVVAGGAVVVVAVVGSAAPFHRELGTTVKARFALWGEYLHEFEPFGAGPASAGSAYDKVVSHPWDVPLQPPNNWAIGYDRIKIPAKSEAIVRTGGFPLRVKLRVRSSGFPRLLNVTLGHESPRGKRLLRGRIPVRRAVPVSFRIRGPSGDDRFITLLAPPIPKRRPPPPVLYGGRLVNLALEPSVERKTGHWLLHEPVKGVSATRVRGHAVFGRWALQIDGALEASDEAVGSGVLYTALSVVEGRQYTVSVYLRSIGAAEQLMEFLTLDTFNPDVVTRGRPFSISNTWRRYTHTFTAGKTSRGVVFLVEPRATGAATTRSFRLDGLQIERGATATPYCDGSLPHCRWARYPHGSVSYRAASTVLASELRRGRLTGVEGMSVRSTGPPMPQRTPFILTVDQERLEVLRIDGPHTYRVLRGLNDTRPRRHAGGSVVWAALVDRATRLPPVETPNLSTFGTALTFQDLRLEGLPPPRTPAEHVWNRWFARTPAALAGDGPGLVDNLYVSWLFQYGLLGVLLCGVWWIVLLRPVFARNRDSATLAAAMVGVFLVTGAFAVSVWEEAPTDLLGAFVLAFAYRSAVAKRPEAAGLRGRTGGRLSLLGRPVELRGGEGEKDPGQREPEDAGRRARDQVDGADADPGRGPEPAGHGQ